MTFDQFVDQAWTDHADQSPEVADRLKDQVAKVSSQEQIPQIAALITHVYGEHLGRWSDGIALLEQLQHQADSAENRNTIFRSLSALRLAGGLADSVDDLMNSDQIRVLCVASAALVGQNEIERAMAYFNDALKLADEGLPEKDPAIRSLAVTGNNLASALEGHKNLKASEITFMVSAARASLKYWLLAGEWPQHQIAHFRLSKCLLVAGAGVEALEEAMSCLAICKVRGAGAYDMFWANEAVASVIHVSKPSAFAEYLGHMRECYAALGENERKLCESRLKEMESSIS